VPAVGIGPGSQMPTQFMVHQNYPNPFNPTTNINYDLPNAANVEINIFNTAGQKIRTLVSGMQQAGYHVAEWDATNDTGAKVSTGVYIYQAVIDNNVSTFKMLLVK
jgi:flagellar hook assembly protein FlgD